MFEKNLIWKFYWNIWRIFFWYVQVNKLFHLIITFRKSITCSLKPSICFSSYVWQYVCLLSYNVSKLQPKINFKSFTSWKYMRSKFNCFFFLISYLSSHWCLIIAKTYCFILLVYSKKWFSFFRLKLNLIFFYTIKTGLLEIIYKDKDFSFIIDDITT